LLARFVRPRAADRVLELGAGCGVVAVMLAALYHPREIVAIELQPRLAAMIAMGAPPASYLFSAEAAAELGITADDIQGVMIGVAPVVGAPRVVAAGGNIMRALGFAIAVTDSDTQLD
jgi:phospholipid N-methyltransferase